MPTKYKIAQDNNGKFQYFSFPGVFSNEDKKILSFRFPPVLHLAGLLEIGHTNLEIVKDESN